jgi:hypothetical protein
MAAVTDDTGSRFWLTVATLHNTRFAIMPPTRRRAVRYSFARPPSGSTVGIKGSMDPMSDVRMNLARALACGPGT